MNLRTSYFVTVLASALALFSSCYFIDSATAAEPLRITGPNGQMKQTSSQYGPTKSADTFWSIAQRMRPDPSLSIYQVMAAIYDANPHAFSSANFNSLEKGMILLIPSEAAMSAIPKSLAKKRAERDDKDWSGVTSKPKAKKVSTPKTITSTKPIVSAQDTTKIKMLAAKVEELEARNLALTDELARAQDLATVGDTDFSALQKQTEELQDRVAMLEETLQTVKQLNAELRLENLEMKQSLAKHDQQVPDDLWRTIMGNPLYLILVTAVPALLLLLLLWLFLRRRKKKDSEALAYDGDATGSENSDKNESSEPNLDMGEDADSLDALLGVDNAGLKPESDADIDLFVESEDELGALDEEDDDEGQSLDDLWAEAMGDDDEPGPESQPDEPGEFDSMFEGLEDEAGEEDLDSLLAGLDIPDEQSLEEDQLDSVENESDFASLADELDHAADENIEQLSASIEADDLKAAIAAELDTETELQGSVIDDDIDALLAGFDGPAEDVEPAAEVEPDSVDDIDALLAGFDAPTEEVEPAAEVEPDSVDDIDALLAGFDAPTEEVDPAAEAEPESVDDIDALLAGFDAPTEEVEPAAEVEPESVDDIDALLAGFDAPTEEVEPGAEAEPESVDDIDSLLADLDSGSVDEDPIDSLLESVEDEPQVDKFIGSGSDDIDSLLTDIDSDLENGDIETSTDDIDSLLADLDTPTEPELSANVDSLVDSELETMLANSDTPELDRDSTEPADTLLTDVELNESPDENLKDDLSEVTEQTEIESSFFNDLKANKSDSPATDNNMLEWESTTLAPVTVEPVIEESTLDELPIEEAKDEDLAIDDVISSEFVAEDDIAPVIDDELVQSEDPDLTVATDTIHDEPNFSSPEATEPKPKFVANVDVEVEPEINDDDLLAAFAQNSDLDMSDVNTAEDDFVLDSDDANLTVDEALAALDAEIELKQAPLPEHDLANFQQENGFIDIDKLLNEASEGDSEADPYKDIDMDMGDINALMGSGVPVDVDDEENSVNAKLDLARAYIEIDDKDSAKALLQEVALDGNERQKAESEILLKDMG